MTGCVFCKIRDRVIPKEFIFEDEDIMAFPDINPVKPIHVLIIPKKHIEDFLDVDDGILWNKLKKTTQKMVNKFKLENKGYRVGVNGGGAQIIKHLHIHLIGPLGKDASI